MTQKFEDKVRAMTAKEIILAMVNGLRHPKVTVDMKTFGDSIGGVCFGCAATCAVLEIAQVKPVPQLMNVGSHSVMVNSNYSFVLDFEDAIECLRTNNVKDYNKHARKRGFATIYRPQGFSLPYLDSRYLDQLAGYERLAEIQPVRTKR